MAKVVGYKGGKPVPADARSCVFYHRLATGTTLTTLTFFAGVSKQSDGVGVTNLDDTGRIGGDRNFLIHAIAFDPIGVAAADIVDLLSFQHSQARLLKNTNEVVMRAATRAIGSVGGPGRGFIDAASAGTGSELVFGGGPLVLHEPEPFHANDRIALEVEMAAVLATTRDIVASLLGFETVED